MQLLLGKYAFGFCVAHIATTLVPSRTLPVPRSPPGRPAQSAEPGQYGRAARRPGKQAVSLECGAARPDAHVGTLRQAICT
ncbi:hypothetical protein DPEC_G00349350 [Dallia pectoralis]|uniref:Uncharacterized protein n=1 Tax=Dallia pectoralis TaxID=75939 RepID=A0ACC2F1N0_DALPE|nr:hypothetical protein DPEC_G00349350 [Dallia pectoralis]